MSKTNLTKKLEEIFYNSLDSRNDFACPEVTIGWHGRERVDFMIYTTSREIRCYEVKVSKSDFYSKAKNTFVGNRNYYVMPTELFEVVKDDIPAHIGVYCLPTDEITKYNPRMYSPRRPLKLTNVKKAKVQELTVNKEVLMGSMIRSMNREMRK